MSLHYIIDGYNLLYGLPDLPTGTLQQKREALLRLLSDRRPQGNNRTSVIFDSAQGLGDRFMSGGIELIFTAGETADQWIAEHVRAAPHRRSIVVVSDDKGIRDWIRGTGARWLDNRTFLNQARTVATEDIPPNDNLDDITESLKKEWL